MATMVTHEAPKAPKVPGTDGDAETETRLLFWALATLSPKVPGTNGDANGDVRDVRSKRLTKGCGKTCTKIGTSIALKD
jgi:hypothetical protein